MRKNIIPVILATGGVYFSAMSFCWSMHNDLSEEGYNSARQAVQTYKNDTPFNRECDVYSPQNRMGALMIKDPHGMALYSIWCLQSEWGEMNTPQHALYPHKDYLAWYDLTIPRERFPSSRLNDLR